MSRLICRSCLIFSDTLQYCLQDNSEIWDLGSFENSKAGRPHSILSFYGEHSFKARKKQLYTLQLPVRISVSCSMTQRSDAGEDRPAAPRSRVKHSTTDGSFVINTVWQKRSIPQAM